MSQEKRLKMFHFLKSQPVYMKVTSNNQPYYLVDASSNISTFENKNFSSESAVQDLHDILTSERFINPLNNTISYFYEKTLPTLYKDYCCDGETPLEWALDSKYCKKTDKPTGGGATGGGATGGGGTTTISCPTTTATGADIISGTLIKNCTKGTIVGEIQKHLKKHGFGNFSKGGNIDNVFGNKTEKMVFDFQNATKGLTPDGVVGPKTWIELVKDKTTTPVEPKKTPITFTDDDEEIGDVNQSTNLANDDDAEEI